MKKIKPLLASKAEMEKIKYPVAASPKLDGIRCLVLEDGAKSRNMKPIPNHYIRKTLSELPCIGCDGELMVDGDFNEVQSAIMSQDGEPEFYYSVFDCFQDTEGNDISELPFVERYAKLYENFSLGGQGKVRIVPHILIEDEESLLKYLRECIDNGFEGVMIRKPSGPYKFGRSTVNQGILLKIKEFFDDEGMLVDITEKMRNDNELEKDELGYAKRSSCKENLVPADTAGSLTVCWQDKVFKIGFGPGINDKIKKDWWDRRLELIGKQIKFSYQELSKDGIPRFGKALGFRHEGDLSG